ncbi:MAG: AAA family ATPase [Proteobacteria bacterium]|nr:AAA family ATPase [Cystobacterineae bacterium]MCL2314119.1 AAA family ATPase [Pseudomonadota bacterium]
MLIEFRVKNFRSLRDEQVLSLVASKDKTLVDSHASATGLKAAPHLLKSAVLYGANASGKSNIMSALQYMRGVVVESASVPPGQTFAVQPFRLNTKFEKQPSEFEMSFIMDGVRYQYGFAMTPRQIIHEHLLVHKAFKPQHWFERRFNEATNKYVYKFGTGLKGSKNVWESATRSNALFLSTAAQLNSEMLRPILDWFANQLLIFNETSPLGLHFTVQMLQQGEEARKRICDFLNTADISISDIHVSQRKEIRPVVRLDSLTGKMELRSEEVNEAMLQFSHVTDAGKAKFSLAEESAGTRNLLFLSGPVLEILSKGQTLVIDELSNLHTHWVQALVRLFHNPKVNTGGAQLVFTTHDTSLLDAHGLFRRDQIWFVEKQADQSSKLYSLWEYSPRKDEKLERSYLQGRYGAVPVLSGPFGGAG